MQIWFNKGRNLILFSLLVFNASFHSSADGGFGTNTTLSVYRWGEFGRRHCPHLSNPVSQPDNLMCASFTLIQRHENTENYEDGYLVMNNAHP